MTAGILRQASLSLRLRRRNRRRDRAAQEVVKQLGWRATARDWEPYRNGDHCPYCGSKSVAVRCENWTHRETGDVYGIDLHWCNNNHMWLRDTVV